MPGLNQLPLSAFTHPFDHKVRVLFTKIGISPYKKTQPIKPEPQFEGTAIWDTGATGSVVTPKVSSKLKLVPIGKKQVHGVHGVSWVNEYLVNIFLPNRVQIVGIPVTEAGSIIGNFDVLIGMDIITLGDFAVTNPNNETKLTYQMPSTHNIDFVEEIRRTTKNTQIKEKLKRDREAYNKAFPKKKKRKRR